MTYATVVKKPLMLAVSAALHGLPFVLVGQGGPSWRWYEGGGWKMPGVYRALQLLDAAAPEAAVVFADGGDTVVANAPSAAAGRIAEVVRDARDARARVLVSAECNSWPHCYADAYREKSARWRACVERSPGGTCFPNTGLYLGSSASLARFVGALLHTMGTAMASQPLAERFDDQAAFHHLYLAGRPAWGNVSLRLDEASSLFLSMYRCDAFAGGAKRSPLAFKGRAFEFCHERTNEPRLHVAVEPDASRLTYAHANGSRADAPSAPLMLHANGKHGALTVPQLAPLMARLRGHLETQAAALRRYPVLLVDSSRGGAGASAAGGACRLSTLGELGAV